MWVLWRTTLICGHGGSILKSHFEILTTVDNTHWKEKLIVLHIIFVFPCIYQTNTDQVGVSVMRTRRRELLLPEGDVCRRWIFERFSGTIYQSNF